MPLAALAPLTLKLQRDGLMEAEKSLQGAVAIQTTKSVGYAVTQVAETTHRVGRLLTSASAQSERDPEGGASIVALAKREVEDTESLASLVVYDREGGFIDAILRTPKGLSRSLDVPREPLDGALRARGEDGAWQVGVNGEGDVISYVEPLRVEGKITGWVKGNLVPGALSALVTTVSEERLDGPDHVFLVDEELRVIAAARSNPLKLGDSLRGKYMFSSTSPSQLDWDVPFQSSTGGFVGATGESMRGAYSTLGRHRWLVVVQRPEREVLKALRGTQQAFLVAMGGAALLALLIAGVLAARSTRPIESLVALTRAYSARRFDARSDVRTGDEIEELGVSLGDMASAIEASELEIARKGVVEAQLSRYMPAEIATAIAEGKRSLSLGGERRRVSVLFADINAFTTFAERSSPERVVSFLNEVFSILSEVVFRHGGMVDKFMGDCIMAVFGAADHEPDHADRALAAAEDMHRFVETQAPAWKRDYDFDVRLAIGVATGEALVGNLGSEARMEFTAIGDTVNLASRLESLAQAGQTLVSAEVAEAVRDRFDLRALGRHPIRGKKEPVALFELR